VDTAPTFDVFLSHASEDTVWCEKLAECLRAAGVSVWFDQWEMKPGDHLLVKLNEGLSSSRRMIAVWSSNYFRDAKVWTLFELYSNQHSDPLSSKRSVIPILIEDCKVPPTLRNVIFADFRDKKSFETSLRLLVDSLDLANSVEIAEPGSSREAPGYILNSYLPYAFGGVVVDPQMFFGRRALLLQMKQRLCSDTVGSSLVLSGQKRSGKSSLIWNLAQQLSKPVLGVLTSAHHLYDYGDSLTQLLLNELRNALEFGVQAKPARWPSQDNVLKHPIDAFMTAMWCTEEALLARGWNDFRVVFLIDEFTSVNSDYRRNTGRLDAIMNEWQALRSTATFSSILVGSESMEDFLSMFPNHFGASEVVRLGYLTMDEMRMLAEQPILLNGKTRYRGTALNKLYALTAGSPFYTQMVCSELVRHLNEQRRLLITEDDLAEVVKRLLTLLADEHFDPLINGDGDLDEEYPLEAKLRMLCMIADRGTIVLEPSDYRHRLLTSLLAREVIVENSDNHFSVRVGLFEEWLRSVR
jgi:hypothetical protein